MIVVTGAAGFIGSCLVAKLDELGRSDLILVDHYDHESDPKKKNLEGKKYLRYFDKAEYLKLLRRDTFDFDVSCIFHIGACSSTTLQDADYFEKNNFEYSTIVAHWALKYNARFIYATASCSTRQASSRPVRPTSTCGSTTANAPPGHRCSGP